MDCAEFLEEYSSYRDGSLDEDRALALAAHLEGCASCTRYDRVIGEGVDVFRNLPSIEPSYDFLPRLRHRIYHLEDDRRLRERRASGASSAVMLAMAVAIGLTAWAPVLRSKPSVVHLPPVVAHAPHRVEAADVLFRSGPLLTRQPSAVRFGGMSNTGVFHRYSPLGSFASYPNTAVPVRAP